MLKHISDNTKNAHYTMLRDYDSISFPEDPRFTREVWKATCRITIEDLNQWVAFNGPPQVRGPELPDLVGCLGQYREIQEN